MRRQLAHIIGSLSLWAMSRLDPDTVKKALTPEKETPPDLKDIDPLKTVKPLPPAIEVPLDLVRVIAPDLACIQTESININAVIRIREALEKLPGFVSDPEIEWELDLNFAVNGRRLWFAPVMLRPRYTGALGIPLDAYLRWGVMGNPNTKPIS